MKKMMNTTEIESRVNENKFTEQTYPGCTDEEYTELNEKLLAMVIAENPDEYNIHETIQRVQEKLHF
jgi:hypothetical protein